MTESSGEVYSSSFPSHTTTIPATTMTPIPTTAFSENGPLITFTVLSTFQYGIAENTTVPATIASVSIVYNSSVSFTVSDAGGLFSLSKSSCTNASLGACTAHILLSQSIIVNAQTEFSIKITATSISEPFAQSSQILTLPLIPSYNISLTGSVIKDDYVPGSPIGYVISTTSSGRGLACLVSSNDTLSNYFVIEYTGALVEYGYSLSGNTFPLKIPVECLNEDNLLPTIDVFAYLTVTRYHYPSTIYLHPSFVEPNATIGSVVGILSVNQGNATHYSLLNNFSDHFALENGNVIVVGPQFHHGHNLLSAYTIVVSVTDIYNYVLVRSVNISTIPEVLSLSHVTLSNATIYENSPPNTIIGFLSTAITGSDGPVNYTIVSDPDGVFAIQGNALIATVSFDYAVSSYHHVVIEAKTYFATANATFSIQVLPVPANVMLVPHDYVTFEVGENSLGTVVGAISATSMNSIGLNFSFSSPSLDFLQLQAPECYSLGGIKRVSCTASVFFNDSSLNLIIARDILGSVFIFDSGNNELLLTANVTVHVREDFSSFSLEGPNNITFPEHSAPNTVLGNFTVHNAEPQEPLQCSISGSNYANALGVQAKSHSSYDIIVLAQNFVGMGSFTVYLNCSYARNTSFFSSLSMDVIIKEVNAPPTDILLSSTSVKEKSVDGVVVGVFTAIDSDQEDTFAFSLISDPGAYFAIANNNSLVVAALILYSQIHSVNITVRVTDNGMPPMSYEKEFMITIIQVDDCRPGVCQNGGECLNSNVDIGGGRFFTCNCSFPYNGTFCEEKINFCNSSPCMNGGLCQDLLLTYSCDCNGTGYEGTQCTSPVLCNNDNRSHSQNDFGVAGVYYGQNVTYICDHGYAVNPTPGSKTIFQEVCQANGIISQTNSCVMVDECLAQPCMHNGLCTSSLLSFNCSCPFNYSSPLCAFPSQCYPPAGSSTIIVQSANDVERIKHCIRVHGDLWIMDTLLTSLSGFVLQQVDGVLNISNNALLQSMQGPNITEAKAIIVDSNALLQDVAALNGVNISEKVVITNNPSLTDLSGLGHLVAVSSGDLILQNLPALYSLQGLSALSYIGGNLKILNNSGLMRIVGLSVLTVVEQSLFIENVPVLLSLDQPSQLQTIGQQLIVENNALLRDLNALSNLNSVVHGVIILDNPQLCYIGAELLSYVFNTQPSIGWQVSGNAANCPIARLDSDGDLVYDDVDNCPHIYNPSQVDVNHNGVGDACDCIPVDPCLNGGICTVSVSARTFSCACPFEYTGITCNSSLPAPLPTFFTGDTNTFFTTSATSQSNYSFSRQGTGIASSAGPNMMNTVGVKLGSVSFTTKFNLMDAVTTQLLSTETVKVTLLSGETVYSDASTVAFAVGAFVSKNNFVPTIKLTNTLDGSSILQNCSLNSNMSCLIQVSIPESWFCNTTVPLSVTFLNIQGSWSTFTGGTVALNPSPVSSILSSAALLSVSQKTLFPGDTAKVILQLPQSTMCVSSFSVSLTIDSTLFSVAQVISGSPSIDVRFAATYNGRVGFSGLAQGWHSDCVNISSLFTAVLQFSGTASLSPPLTSTIAMSSLTVWGGSTETMLPLSITYSDRNGVNVGGGTLYLGTLVPSSLILMPSEPVMINSAMLSGTSVTAPLLISAFAANGQIIDAANVMCTSGDTSILHVSSDCSSIFLDGSEALGSSSVKITAFIVGSVVSDAVYISVLYPQLPISMKLSRNPISLVKDWVDSSCLTQYQYATVSASAIFTAGPASSTSISLDISGIIAANLKSSSPKSATIQVSQASDGSAVEARVLGVAAGSSFISLTYGARTLGLVLVFVSDSTVAISTLSLSPVANLSVSVAPWPATGLNNEMPSFTAIASIQRKLSREGQVAPLVASVYFSDHTQENIAASKVPGLQLSSLDQSVIDIQEDSAVAVGSGQGPLIAAAITGLQCHNRTLASLNASLQVELPQPDGIYVTLTDVSIAAQGQSQLQYALSMPNSTWLSVQLLFTGQHLAPLDVSGDTRTIIEASSPSIIVFYESTVGAYKISSSQAGTFNISVSFTQYPQLQQSVTLHVVQLSDASVVINVFPASTPYQPIPLPASQFHLYGVANSDVYQQGIISVVLLLSNGSVSIWYPNLYEVSLSESSIAVLSTTSQGTVITPTGTRTGSANVQVWFAGASLVSSFVVASNQSSIVTADSIYNVTFPVDLSGPAGFKQPINLIISLSDA